MSRLVVKNLPKKITIQKLKEIFSEKGQVTDLQLKYTKTGKFRQFAFIGYKTEDEAQAAKSHFHNTFIQTSRIKVDICRPLGDESVKPWSKHTKKANEEPKSGKEALKQQNLEKKHKKNRDKKKGAEFAAELEDDKTEKKTESDSGNGSSEDEADGNSENNDASAKKMSDMEYLRSKVKASAPQTKKEVKKPNVEFTVKLRNLPFSCKRKHIKAFFHPLKPISIRIPPGKSGFAFVGFSTEKDMKRAINKHKGFLDGHKVYVTRHVKKEVEHVPQEDGEKDAPTVDTVELIAETGRIFVKNLCFSVTEQELKDHFAQYGPIAELHLPVDFYTKQILGYALISYIFAEHAVKAYSELDGTVFQGRMLHIIPGQPKKEPIVDPKEMTFKEKKTAKQKSLAHSSHNWNTLFLGPNAVADVMAKEYDMSKANILSSEAGESVAVRMALGETQIVVSTRKFLMQHGVKLDAFSQAAAKRSSTVIIAKNLPANTTAHQLQTAFSRFGTINRVILPPSGVTALIEFQESMEAKRAFNKLAYTRFGNKPLYLEWAPLDVFSAEPLEKNTDTCEDTSRISDEKTCEETDNLKQEGDDQQDDDDVPPEGATLFVKNLNFDTTEEKLKRHFKVCGPLYSVTISRKKDLKSGKLLSMGFGFVQYKKKSSAQTAMQDLQSVQLDGHALELKYSNRATVSTVAMSRKKNEMFKASTKICIRNVPFEATQKEIRDLFEPFGELKFARLPKQTSMGKHRGFGFVEFVQKRCAKRAFEALCHSTHLLGRRLVLEWALPDTEDVDTLRKKTTRDSQQSEPERRVKKAKLMEDALLAKPADSM